MKHKTLSHRLPLPSTLSTPSHFSSVFFLVQPQTCSSSSPEQHHCSNKPLSPTKESCRKGKRFLWIDSYVGQSDQRGALLSEFQRGEWHRILRPTMGLVFPSSRLLLDRCCCWKKMLMSAFWCGMIWIDNAFEWGCVFNRIILESLLWLLWMSRAVQDETKQQRQVSPGDGMQLLSRVSWKRVVEFEFGEMSSCYVFADLWARQNNLCVSLESFAIIRKVLCVSSLKITLILNNSLSLRSNLSQLLCNSFIQHSFKNVSDPKQSSPVLYCSCALSIWRLEPFLTISFFIFFLSSNAQHDRISINHDF